MLRSFDNVESFNLKTTYDVVICGGGLAGMTLARQLKLEMSDISILVIDRLAKPLPISAFKVGESTVEIGTNYLTETLDLKDYFNQHHMQKLGLRFFLGKSHKPLNERPEIGVASFKLFNSKFTYHMDRGLLENDLREFNLEAGIDLLEHGSVQSINLNDSKDFHSIVCKQLDTKKIHTFKARWVVDAMGRRRFLQKKLGLEKSTFQDRSAVWFRINERVDVSDLVPLTNSQWHNRVPNNIRYYSANHLVGEGYWVWLIPLPSGYTSIGIVTSDRVHNFKEYSTYEKACNWLQKHEPILAEQIKDRQPADFMKMPKYSYSSTQVFSFNRWTCVGEAGAFPDPLYSPGTDMIALGNTLTTELIKLDLSGKLNQKMVDHANRFYLKTNDNVTTSIGGSYQLLGKSPVLFLMQYIWKAMFSWATVTPLIFNSVFLDPDRMEKFDGVLEEFSSLAHQVEQLFKDWSNKPTHRLSFEFIDYLGMLPFVNQFRSNLFFKKTDLQLIDDYIANLKILEELAQVIFLLALEDTMPNKLTMFSEPVWLNAWAISLDVDTWEGNGLFKPKSQPRDLHRVMKPLKDNIQLISNQSVSKSNQKIYAVNTVMA
ncbi:tryptophan 7-halogenase [Moorena sp. SIO3H5]|uniref:NAD(P)/FAD-dependent oxidoreductase n=1 Tax=Moorena sp. SIO3H5 TaxID=2607834 RepID=UPI0013BB2932|nr:tryptophan 7-halogenase [Moorena sp. SIO3H5]NEO69704.1 FAD-dependent oxidoreductase [Moorena sp. SIO3H5]